VSAKQVYIGTGQQAHYTLSQQTLPKHAGASLAGVQLDVAVSANDETSYAGFVPQQHDCSMITWTPAAAVAGIT